MNIVLATPFSFIFRPQATMFCDNAQHVSMQHTHWIYAVLSVKCD